MKILVLFLVLITVTIMAPYQIKAFGEISTLTPPENTIKVNGTNFAIPYSITGGRIISIQADTDAKTIVVQIQSITNGTLKITLPKALIDAQKGNEAAHYAVLNNNHGSKYTELENSENRTLTVPFNLGTSTIEIKGGYMVPEFGQAALVAIISFFSIILIQRNFIKYCSKLMGI